MASAERPDDAGFLSRWSRRKREASQPVAPQVTLEDEAREEKAVAPADASPAVDDQALATPRPSADEPPLPELPSLDSITAETDITAFMDRRVPEPLRLEALRRAWITDPAIRDFVSPALDYALDYNTPGAAPGYGPLTASDMVGVAKMIEKLFDRPLPDGTDKVVADMQAPSAAPQEAERNGDGAAQQTALVPDQTSTPLDVPVSREEPNDGSNIPETAGPPLEQGFARVTLGHDAAQKAELVQVLEGDRPVRKRARGGGALPV